MANYVEELKWRGMFQDATPGIEELLYQAQESDMLDLTLLQIPFIWVTWCLL